MVEPLKEDGEKGVDGKNAEWTTLKQGGGFELFAANVIEFEKTGVLRIEFGGCIGDLRGEAYVGEELVGEGGVDTIKALTPIIGESCVVVAKQFGDFDAEVFG